MTTTTPTPELERTVIQFKARDGMALDLHHVTGPRPPTRGPVLLVHGAGVRADIFRPPAQVTLVDALVAEGWDVWLENWRASIDVPPTTWDLDEAAVHDHPAAVDTVLEHTGAETLKAVVHCQGSSSFVLSAVAGLLPKVDTIVSNAMSLHPVISPLSRVKIQVVVPYVAKLMPFLSPRWALDPPDDWRARAIVAFVRLSHRECSHTVCRMVSFTYGAGFPALWSHDNISDETHDWIDGEFADVPFTFFLQMRRSVLRGHLVTSGRFSSLPSSVVAQPPQTDARFALIAGRNNHCFLPESQQRTFEFLDGHRPGHHSLHLVPNYGHLDVLFWRNAPRDTYPLILEELAR
jgi:pimeloyl-ACP methyl ester carboxylesterase